MGVPKLPARIVVTQILIRFFIETSKCDIETIELLELYNLYITNRSKKKKKKKKKNKKKKKKKKKKNRWIKKKKFF